LFKTLCKDAQRNFPVAVVDNILHQETGGFFGGGVLTSDVPEAVGASFDVEFLEDVAGTVDVEVAALNVCGEAHVHIRVVAFSHRGPSAGNRSPSGPPPRCSSGKGAGTREASWWTRTCGG